MHDFGKLAYLDVHKTGSSYVSDFLNTCCTLQQVRFSKHDWVREDYRQDCFYFITIRNPIDMWSSLYRFGLDKKGDVYNRLYKIGLSSKYESFNSFVEFCLNEKNADLLGFDYNEEISKLIGFMSFRFLKLSLRYPMKQIRQCINNSLNLQALENNFITKLEIKNEMLDEGLINLSMKLYPQYFNAEKVSKYIHSNSKVNASKISKYEIDSLSDKNLENLHHKESLLISRY
jgi:predicted amidophosphoribosyltransferase